MNIIFSGGGTLGPVTPLLAIHDIIQKIHPDARFVWVGTRRGPERALVIEEGIPFYPLSSGKFRRYLSAWNVLDIARIGIGFFQSIWFLLKEKPDLCISAGGFISVPLHWAAWFLGIPTWVHQQDVGVGLSNKLMAPIAKRITTALEKSMHDFSRKKTLWFGNPVRPRIFEGERARAMERFHLDPHLPVVFVTGGGTGSLRVNQLIVEAAQSLNGVCQIIHLSGKERPQELVEKASTHLQHYHAYTFFTREMNDAYAIADIVVSRGGFGTISELAALKKPAILVPKGGHQEENVAFLEHAGAAIFLDETTSTGNDLARILRILIKDTQKRTALGEKLSQVLPSAKADDVLRVFEGVLLKDR